MTDSRGFTGFFTCDCIDHAYHSNCKDCKCNMFGTIELQWAQHIVQVRPPLTKGDN